MKELVALSFFFYIHLHWIYSKFVNMIRKELDYNNIYCRYLRRRRWLVYYKISKEW